MGIGYSLGLLTVDLIHDIGKSAPTYYPKVLSPSIVTPFSLIVIALFALSAIIRVFGETCMKRATLRVTLLVATTGLFVDVIKT